MPAFPSTDEMALCGMWKQVDVEYAEKLVFELTYVQHGGSGMTWTRSDVLDMGFDEAHRAMEALRERRIQEARAIRSAHRRAGR